MSECILVLESESTMQWCKCGGEGRGGGMPNLAVARNPSGNAHNPPAFPILPAIGGWLPE
jgi:hypothetical protein